MYKKLLIVITLILFAIAVVAVTLNFKYIKRLYTYKTTNFQDGIGAILSSPSPQLLAEGEAISVLRKSLPLSAQGFTIIDYNYSTGQFIVSSNKASDLQVAFDDWYASSKFIAIPKSMFQLILTTNEGSLKD
jgi:hypothetical protein